MRTTVVGAGVTGLTTATALADAGYDVTVVAREAHEATVSLVAAAVWTMTSVEPFEATRRWALASHHRFATIAGQPGAGVTRMLHRELERQPPAANWWEGTPYVRRLTFDELPAGYGGGFLIDGFVVEPPRYLAWLRSRLGERGVPVEIGEVADLADVDGELVVNCTGLGAAELAADDGLFPIRGQVVAVANPGIDVSTSDESDPSRIAYAYPRTDEVVLGGTRQVGASDVEPDDAETDRILADAAVLDPRLQGQEVFAVRVGLRPGRAEVRLEPDRLADGRSLIHNYGHAGAGYILSWGCALDVVDLAGRRAE